LVTALDAFSAAARAAAGPLCRSANSSTLRFLFRQHADILMMWQI
jgi:hypothetical protein